MKTRCLPLAAALALAASLSAAMAQTAAPVTNSASAPAPAKPGPRPQTPTELRDSSLPTDLRPDEPVTPQISIPLGKTTPAPLKSKLRAARPSPVTPSGGINDEVARCEAQSDQVARAKCRDQLAHQSSSR
jgi:hypothetical protein